MTDKLYVIGIDPSLSGTGIAHEDGALETVKTKTSDGAVRLRVIYESVKRAITNAGVLGHGQVLAVIEDLPTHAKSAGLTGQAQGAVRMALADNDASFIAIAPATLKKFATGSGRADKLEMRAAWEARTGDEVKDDNQVDAAFLREYGRVLRTFALATGHQVRYRSDVLPKTFEQDVEIARGVAHGLRFL